MAMNFKVFENKDQVAEYSADIIRKQFNNNPTTIAGFHLNKEASPVLDMLKKNVDQHAVDFSQINILDYDQNQEYFKALGFLRVKFILSHTIKMLKRLSLIKSKQKIIKETNITSSFN